MKKLRSFAKFFYVYVALVFLSNSPTELSTIPATVFAQDSQQTRMTKTELSPVISIAEIESPAGAESFLPNLATTADGRALLSWVEPAIGGGHKLLFSIRQGESWTPASTIYTYKSGELLFTEPTAPTLIALGDGTLVAQWLVKIKGALDAYARNVCVSISRDGGKNWSKPIIPHRGGKMSDHSFVSMAPMGRSNVALFWLDGRKMKYSSPTDYEGPMALMHTTISSNGELGREVEIDDDVCTCCPTSGALTARGLIVAYRDHTNEIRDISFARFIDNRWSKPQPLHNDNWEIDGCPVNGPVFSAEGNRVAVVWYTAAKDAPEVKIRFSEDAGDRFGNPIRVDEGSPSGRADVALLDKDGALVSWVELTKQGPRILVRHVRSDGRRSAASIVRGSESGKGTGFPHLARSGDHWIVAWTDPSGGKRVRTAAIRITGE